MDTLFELSTLALLYFLANQTSNGMLGKKKKWKVHCGYTGFCSEGCREEREVKALIFSASFKYSSSAGWECGEWKKMREREGIQKNRLEKGGVEKRR